MVNIPVPSNIKMGRINKQWRHTIGLGIEVSARDAPEALRRIEDVRDALQARFSGSEIYPPRIAGSRSRIAGSPTFRHFLVASGRPTEVALFEDELALAEKSLGGLDVTSLANTETKKERGAQVERAASNLAQLLRQNIDAGWIPSHGSIADAVGLLDSALNPEAPPIPEQ